MSIKKTSVVLEKLKLERSWAERYVRHGATSLDRENGRLYLEEVEMAIKAAETDLETERALLHSRIAKMVAVTIGMAVMGIVMAILSRLLQPKG